MVWDQPKQPHTTVLLRSWPWMASDISCSSDTLLFRSCHLEGDLPDPEASGDCPGAGAGRRLVQLCQEQAWLL